MLNKDDMAITFGKYKGFSLNAIAEHNPSYIVWLVDTVKEEGMVSPYLYKKCRDFLKECANYTACEGDIKIEGLDMDFGKALAQLRRGYGVTRKGWNGKGLWLELQIPDDHSKMTLPYIYINYPSDAQNTPGARVPWVASQTDILAEDWVVIE